MDVELVPFGFMSIRWGRGGKIDEKGLYGSRGDILEGDLWTPIFDLFVILEFFSIALTFLEL